MIDIDSHRFPLSEEKAEIIKDILVLRLSEDYKTNIVPDEILYTTRGFQLFYNVNEYDPSKRRIHSLAKDFRSMLIEEIEILINDFNKFFKDTGVRMELEIDKSTSTKRQLFRCPGFINTKSGEEAHFIFHQEREKRIVMSEHIKELKDELGIKPTGRKFVKFKKNRKFNNINNLHDNRITDTISHLNRYKEGVRHKCYTNLITIMLNMGLDEGSIVKELSRIDKECNTNYYSDESKILDDIKVVRDYWLRKTGGVIKVSNSAMVDYLGISDEDLVDYEWLTFSKSSKPKKEGKDLFSEIKEVYKNLSVSEIARVVGCSRTTVYKYIRTIEAEKKEGRVYLLTAVSDNKNSSKKIVKSVKRIVSIDNLNRTILNTRKEYQKFNSKKLE